MDDVIEFFLFIEENDEKILQVDFYFNINLINEIDNRIEIPRWMTCSFELENGKEQLVKVFSKVTVE